MSQLNASLGDDEGTLRIGNSLGDDIKRELGEHILLSPAKVSAVLDVEEGTLATWRSQGGGPKYLKIGRNVSYLEADVIAFIEERRRSSTNGANGSGKAA